MIIPRVRPFIALLALPLVLMNELVAGPKPTTTKLSSVIAENGMPRNIIKAGARWNFGRGSLWTHHGWQYAAYWDEKRQVSVARRKLPSGAWEVISLPDYERTSSGNRGTGGRISRGFGDGHEKVAMGISPDGFIHLAFDHHVSSLRYRTTLKPVADNPGNHEWKPELFGPVRDNLGGEKIETVTYPSFTSDGTKHFSLHLRMNIGSGSANTHFLHYQDGEWTTPDPAAGQIIDKHWSGGNGTVNAYPHGMVIRNGRRHLTWCWRDTPNPRSCHDLCYAYSDDDGETWLNNSGQLIGRSGEKFITADSPGVAAVELGPDSQFVNGGSMTVDTTGRIFVLMRGEDGSPTLFIRDPATTIWSTARTKHLGKLVVGAANALFLVTEDGLWQSTPEDFTHFKRLHTIDGKLFEDSKFALDDQRPASDGWVSVIGQRGRKVTVVDYWIGKETNS